MYTLEQVEKIGREYEAKIRKSGYDIPNRVVYKMMRKNAYATYGVCTNNITWYETTIRINGAIANEEDLRNTIAHELTHAIKDCWYHNHDEVWQRVGRDVRYTLGLKDDINRLASHKLSNGLGGGYAVTFKVTEFGLTQHLKKQYMHTDKMFVCNIRSKYKEKFLKQEKRGIIKVIKIEEIE